MYLSKLVVNRRCPEVRRDAGDLQEMHRTLMRCFPEAHDKGKARQEHGVLYRVELERDGRMKLLVQSKARPEWGELPARYLDEEGFDLNPAVGSIEQLMAGIEAGRRYRFRLVANPTRSLDVTTEDGRRKEKRVELRQPEEWQEWLGRKAGMHGFGVGCCEKTAVLNASSSQSGKMRGRRNGQELTIAMVRFDGVLGVTEANLFRAAVECGIGRARAYGCGLLSIVPSGVEL